MAKKSKKRKKLSRRARREQPTVAKPEAAAKPEPAPKKDAPIRQPVEPVGISTEAPKEAPPVAPVAKTAVSFRDVSRKRAPSGIDQQIADTEYPAIRRDLRKLGFTIVFFVLVIAGLAVIGSQTDVVTDLGRGLFTLWQ